MYKDIEIMAKTIFGEARGEYICKDGGEKSLIAVGNVIMNRTKKYNKSILTVCLSPKQFSCWNVYDPNLKAINTVSKDDFIFQKCLTISVGIIREEIGDVTNGANHYYSRHMTTPPYWAEGRSPVAKICNHIFFRL